MRIFKMFDPMDPVVRELHSEIVRRRSQDLPFPLYYLTKDKSTNEIYLFVRVDERTDEVIKAIPSGTVITTEDGVSIPVHGERVYSTHFDPLRYETFKLMDSPPCCQSLPISF